MTKSKIEWTEETWNPIVGCSKVSPGCAHCYAETMAKRLKAMGRPEYQNVISDNGKWTGKITVVSERIEQPLDWKRPRMVFVNSMSDLFHDNVTGQEIWDIWFVMGEAFQHTFQILTKRPQRMKAFVDNWLRANHRTESLPNVWLGVSIEDQTTADERIPYLLQTPAAVRFVSAEPLLGPVERDNWLGIDWLIVGGESGPQARPCHPDWVRSLRDQAQAAVVPFFFKQWGMFVHTSQMIAGVHYSETDSPQGDHFLKCTSKHAAGRLLDGHKWNEFPNVG